MNETKRNTGSAGDREATTGPPQDSQNTTAAGSESSFADQEEGLNNPAFDEVERDGVDADEEEDDAAE